MALARCIGLTVVLASVANAAPVAAQPADGDAPQLVLDIVAPQGCPTESEIRAKILAFAGHDAATVHLTALVELRRTDDGGWYGRVETLSRAHAGDREFQGATCDEVATAAAALLALAVDVAPAPAPAPPAPPAAAPRAPVAVAPVAVAPDAVEPESRFRARAVGGADVGALPGVVPAVGVGAAARVRGIDVSIDAAVWDSRNAVLDAELDAGASVQLWAVGGRACYPMRSFGVCAGVEWGIMRGESFGIEMPRADTGQWLAGTSAVTGAWAVWGRLELVAEAGAVVPVISPRFYVQGELAHQPSPLSGRTRLGLQMRFP